METPLISIILPVYNREKYIGESIESILNQTYENFELIIINDGSNDKTENIITKYNDSRIFYYKNENNRGIVFSRNKGISVAKGKYIAMFDSDDIALKKKFEIQIDYMEKKPEIAMTGTYVLHINAAGKLLKTKWKLNASSKSIPSIQIFRNYFVQSSVVIRKDAIPNNSYSTGFDIVEDSKMWFDVALYNKVVNIKQYLLKYRIHDGGISNQRNELHLQNSKKLYKYIFKHLNIDITENEINTHLLIKNKKKIEDIDDLKSIEKWLLKICNHNKIVKLFDQHSLKKVLFNRWIKCCYKSRSLHFKMLYYFLKSKLSRFQF
jgi:glycosyltransferase involved in cell wall biosynthesis